MVSMYWALIPEEIKALVTHTKSLMTPPPSDFEKYLIDDALTWHLEAGDIVDPAEVRSAVRRDIRAIRAKQSVKMEENPPPVQAGGDQTSNPSSGITDDELARLIGDELFGE